MQKLFNNGYVVKGIIKNQWTSFVQDFRGIDEFVSWPLDDFDDEVSKNLRNEAWDRWFGFPDVLEVVPERDYLNRYVDHCIAMGVGPLIFQIETPNRAQTTEEHLDVLEVLGFDCILGVSISYLNLEPKYFAERFGELYQKLNKNRLFNTIEETDAFLNIYNRLLENGENLEHGPNPIPARLSIVKLK